MRNGFSSKCSIAAALLMAGLTASCSSTTDPNEEPPLLPPEASMVIEFGDFMSSGPSPAASLQSVGANWTRSAVIVVSWNTVLSTVLATPVSAFVAAASQQGDLQEDGSWAWVFDFTVVGISHSARLEGSFVPQGVQWDMFISKAGEYSNFHWFSGVSNILATSGQWNLNRNPADPTPFMQIDWTRNPNAGTGDIQYTNVLPGADENGAYISYGLTAGTFDAFYEIFSSSSSNLTSIEWTRQSKDGRVKDELFYGDTVWHCWDVSLNDVNCS